MGAADYAAELEYAKPRRFAILVCGGSTEYMRKAYGGLAGMFERLLSDPEETWYSFQVLQGEFPSDDEVHDYEGFVITGSFYDAHSNEPWVLQLCSLIRKLHSEKRKLLGICFGHQVISRALGGQTGRSDNGWDCGLRKVQLLDAFYTRAFARPSFPSSPIILELHQDQVLKLPPSAELLAFTEKTCYWMYAVENHILCFQGHPEITEDIAMDIFNVCSKDNIPPKVILDAARSSFSELKADYEAFQELCKAFLKGMLT